jgi:hypothetical protein
MLPEFIINKIMLYNIHPIAFLIKKHFLNCVVRDIMMNYNITVYEMRFKVSQREIDYIYDTFHKYSFYPYYVNFNRTMGIYGSLEILDDD